MWAVRIYALVWLVSAIVAVGVYLSGFFNEMALVTFGLFFSTLFALGLVMVLPAWVNEHFAPKY